jgi:hypothetical protein
VTNSFAKIDNVPLSNPPKLFIVEENGTGVELLRDQDLLSYLNSECANPLNDVREASLAHMSKSVALTVTSPNNPLHKVNPPVYNSVTTFRHVRFL